MKSDDSLLIFFIAIAGLAFWAYILFEIIKAANKTTKRDKIQLQNQKILALMAEKLGVSSDLLRTIIE